MCKEVVLRLLIRLVKTYPLFALIRLVDSFCVQFVADI